MIGLLMSAYFIGGVMVLLAVMGIWVAAVMPGLDRWSRRFFISFFAALLLCQFLYAIDMLTYDKPELLPLQKVVSFLEYLLTAVLLPLPPLYLLHCCGERSKGSPLMLTQFALGGLYVLLLVIAQFTDAFYSWDPEFHYGPLHPVLMSPVIAMLLVTLTGTVRRRSRLSAKHFRALLIFVIPLTFSMLITAFVFLPLLNDISITVLSLTMFGIILSDVIEQSMRQERELARQRASIMVLQMRPHFIYNTMTSIYYLCDQDPAKAKQITLDFTTYLRKNFTALASDELIPFAEELEHTRAYLAVEQAQFEDRLFVEYDTPHTAFRLPPLTLQPIVENAVKHGMDPEAEPLRITVRTRETGTGSVITVTDNGPGYEATDRDTPHVALKNIRQRLEMMCRGRMTIEAPPGGGTTVTVTIP